MTDLDHGLAFLLALAGALAALWLALWFWRGRDRRPFGAFALFFAVLTCALAWLASTDFLAMALDNPVVARSAWRPLLFRAALAGGLFVLVWQIKRFGR